MPPKNSHCGGPETRSSAPLSLESLGEQISAQRSSQIASEQRLDARMTEIEQSLKAQLAEIMAFMQRGSTSHNDAANENPNVQRQVHLPYSEPCRSSRSEESVGLHMEIDHEACLGGEDEQREEETLFPKPYANLVTVHVGGSLTLPLPGSEPTSMGCEELFGWSNTKQKGAQEQNRDALSEMEVNECVHQMFAQMPLGGKQLTKKRKRKRWKENVKMKRHKSVLTKIDKWLKRKGKHKQKVKRKTARIELSIHDRELLVELLLHRTKTTTRQKSNSGKWKKRHKLRNKPKKFVKTWQFKFKARNQHILPRTKHDIPNKRTQCLIVLNDIWATDAWDCLQHVFPHGTGSNIIFPTWNREVAFYADPRGVLHAPKFLTSDDSWELLENISLSGREISELKLVRKLAGIGKQMAIRCRGLPLALTVLGGVLAMKKTLHERQRVQETINIYVSNGGGCTRIQNMMVADVLSLSYEDLPFLLKQCFLYSAHYPEDYEVHVGTLVGYWIAEGMVTPVQHMEAGKTVEAIGQAYIEELVKSNMVMIGKRDIVTSDVMTCRMHDLMREVCSQKAEHERFVQVLDSMQPNEAAAFPFKLLKLRLSLLTNTSRRISVQVHGGAAEHRIERLFSQGKLYIPTGIRTFRRLRHLCMPSALERSINLSSQNTDFEVVSSLRTVLKRLCGLTIHVVYELMFPVDVTQLVSVFAYLSELEATVLSRPRLYKSQWMLHFWF